jgi:hypothetical protein
VFLQDPRVVRGSARLSVTISLYMYENNGANHMRTISANLEW